MEPKELTPNSTYRLKLVRPLAESELKTVTHLYLPIIQQEAYSLYLFFYHSVLPDYGMSEIFTHRYLLQMMGSDLLRIRTARRRLEGVGLLRSFRTGGITGYEYHLHPPLTPSEFFLSDVLTLSLLNRVGKEGYRRIREKYLFPTPSLPLSEGKEEEMTASFIDVAPELLLLNTPPSAHSESVHFIREIEEVRQLPPFPSSAKEKIPSMTIDFEYLAGFYPKEERPFLFSEENRAYFFRYALLYDLNAFDLGLILKDSYLGEGKGWDFARFETLIQKLKRGKEAAEEKRAPVEVEIQEPRTEEEHLQTLKSVTPIQLLRNYQDGGEIPQPDQKLVEYLVGDLGLSEEVVNVLIDFVLLTNDNKLPRAYTEKIAGSWKRKGFKTAEEAFAYAREEYWKYAEKEKGNKTARAQEKEAGDRKGRKRREVPQYIWLQAQEDAKQERAREERERKQGVDLDEVKEMIEKLGKRGE